MKSAQQIQQDGTGLKILTRKEIGEVVKAAKKHKIGVTSFFTRKRGNASK